MLSLDEFLSLPTEEVARIVRGAGPQVCVFPINGTRRWFALERPDAGLEDYIRIATSQHKRLLGLLFENGIDTIISPLFGGELMGRGAEYVQLALGGISVLESDSMLQFYQGMDIRVHFYGEYQQALAGTPYAQAISGLVERVSTSTSMYEKRRLFFGFFGNDAIRTILEVTARRIETDGRLPSREELIEAYYGEYVPPATLFIGFDKPAVFDYPLLSSGEEDLYFTVAPSPYLSERAIKQVLYDHVYLRQVNDPDWKTLDEE
ncbi:MAG: diterpene synthase, partial [Chloroflexi bacterium]|nr:diterpene synthase [Chloroflexota bacterium]